MAKIQINRVTNANVYANGANQLGRAEEIKLPDVQALMSEHKALGMFGKMELPGGLDKLEGEIKWNSLYEDSAKFTANPFKTVQLQCRSNIQVFSSGGMVEEVPMVTFLTVIFKKNPMGTFKQHDPAEFASAFTCYYLRQAIRGKDVLELDYMANIFKVDGEDILSTFRDNLGA